MGVGVDVVGVERFTAVMDRGGAALRARLFDPDEADLPARSLAARFAAKEALAKALGAPPGMRWRDARVHRGEHGAPWVEMRGTVAERAAALGVGAVHVSLSHDAGIATAFVVAERVLGAPPRLPSTPAPSTPDVPPGRPDPTRADPTRAHPAPPDPSHPDPTHPS
ncbi:holo-ACP synthase [Pseudokineococcus sp. 5B2Z-1]|uniref:holo-ACP synthase n=1 Tax=Pseudokineococcus sp. 5B2Z-1 TaxID=3132744 RepID=UPI0030B5D303